MIRLLAAVALVACGGAPKAGAPPPPPPPDGTASHAEPRPISDQECDALLAHTLELALAERPADRKISDAEQRTLLANKRAEPGFVEACRAMLREGLACALAAPTIAALEACDAVR